MAFATAEPLRPPRTGRVRSARLELADGARTMAHVACYDAERPSCASPSCAARPGWRPGAPRAAYEEALVGGFFVRPEGLPLGEVRTRGVARRHVPFAAPWDDVRACVHVRGGVAGIAPRNELPAAPRGDLLQAGPLLVRDGVPVFRREDDVEGFRAGKAQFDSDITDGRYPRAALGLADGKLFAVACDGRSRHDAGLTLEELAALMVALGCAVALNLDGGGSTSLVSGGRLRNRPRGGWERAGGRAGGPVSDRRWCSCPRAPTSAAGAAV